MTEQRESIHVPVMCAEVLEHLRAAEEGTYLDCTLGGGGHTEAILTSHPNNRVVAMDRDLRALERAARRFADKQDRVELMHGSFSELANLLRGRKFDGMLADLGVSTDQLREGRGFSFHDQDSLDMRMDESQSLNAADIVNEVSERELVRIFKIGGMGQEALMIARAIVKKRPFDNAAQLANLVRGALHGRHRQKSGDAATVVFQAIRIAVNNELEEISTLLKAAPQLVRDGGRCAVITFHSLEDKAVTSTMRGWASMGSYPASYRGPRTEKRLGRLVTKQAIRPAEEEITRNAASRSARLRIFEFEAAQ